MNIRLGVLSVYSNGHEYVLNEIGEDVATYMIDRFVAFYNESDFDDGDDEEQDLPDGYDYIVSLKYAGIDALVWNAA